MQANRAPRGRAEPAFTLRERELLTEGVAYDAKTRTWFVSSVRHRKIVAVDERGVQRDFITEAQDGIAGVFGMAVDPARRVLWAASTVMPHIIGFRPDDKFTAGLFAFDLGTGKLVAQYPLPRDGRRHALGDVIVSSKGDAYTTDSTSPTLYRVDAARKTLEVVVEGGFKALQGLALSPDEKTLYLADYSRGIYAVSLADKKVTRLEPAPTIAAAGIDGLYLHRGRLIATQNGLEPPRVLAFDLDASGGHPATRLVAQRVLLSGDPRIADLSLGVIVGDAMYLNGAAGWAHYSEDGVPTRDAAAAAHVILKLALPR
jgi:sugar lactone lactonase YvrE